MAIITDIFNNVDTVTNTYISSYTTPFTNLFIPMLGAGIALYMLYKAYEIIWTDKDVMSETMKTLTSLMIVFSIALGSDYYFTYIVPFVLGAGEDISSSLIGGAGGAASIDNMFLNLNKWCGTIWSNADGITESLMALATMAFMFTSGGIFCAIATVYLLVAKIMVSFLLIMGQLFISFAFFPSTRSYFQAWTGQATNYIMLTFLFSLAFGLFEIIFTNLLPPPDTVDHLAMSSSVILYVIMIFISVQIPTLTSTLSGGVGINGLVGNISEGSAAAAPIIKGAAKRSGKVVGGTASGAWGIGKWVAKKARNRISAG